jgi:hypothetical protein
MTEQQQIADVSVRCATFSQAAKAPGEIPLTVLRVILSQQLQLDGRKSSEVKVREVIVPRGSLQLGARGRRLGRSLDG